jgi:peptidoglycan/LPS O-acetylase OafA/YrhL
MFGLAGAMDATAASPRFGNRLPLLDGMRGIAALCVFGFHVQGMFRVPGPFGRSYLFVDFFFLLSGFVLGLVAEPRMLGGLRWSGFLVSRWRRLWPMIVIGALLGTVRFSFENDALTTLGFLVLAILMIPWLSPTRDPYPLNNPQWSLLLELMANLAHSLLLVRLTTKNLMCLTFVAGVALLGTILRDSTNFWLLAELRVGFSYSLGLIFARWRRQGGLAHSGAIDWKMPLLLAASAVLALPYAPLPKAMGDCLMIFAVFPVVQAAAVIARPPAFAAPALLWLGRLSYPLYAVHLPIIALVAMYGVTRWHCAAAVLAAVATASALATLMERPRRRGRIEPTEDKPAIA